ncbi:DUF86 domain-containing protein [Halostagnicola bangensis]
MTVSDEGEARILQKVEYVQESMTVLARKQSLDESTYRHSREQRAIVEREFQTAIEACLDIAAILITSINEPIAETNAGRFRQLGESNILSQRTSEQMQKAAGFRNILAHNYGEDIDDAVVYHHLQNELKWFVQYLREVRECLENNQ